MLEFVVLPLQLITEHPEHAGYEAKSSMNDAYCDPQSTLLVLSPGLGIALVFRPSGQYLIGTELVSHPVLRGPMAAVWAGILGYSHG